MTAKQLKQLINLFPDELEINIDRDDTPSKNVVGLYVFPEQDIIDDLFESIQKTDFEVEKIGDRIEVILEQW